MLNPEQSPAQSSRQTVQPGTKLLALFRSYSPQIRVLIGVAIVLMVGLGVLTLVIVDQVRASARVLTLNDANRVFVQIQRETLRLTILVAEPPTSFNRSTVQTQTDLIESRFVVLNFSSVQAAMPPDIFQRAQQLQAEWSALKTQIKTWMENPADEVRQAAIRKALTDFEFLANDTEVSYSRLKSVAIDNFAVLNQRQLIVFAVSVVILGAFVLMVAFNIYRFNQQRQEVEVIRESNRLKDEFLAVMSHELRTPLNAIIGFMGILKMSRRLDERGLHMVERAHANAVRLLALINDILDMSKIEAGKFEIVLVPVILRKMIDRWQVQMEVLARQKDLDFQVQIEAGLPETVYLDEDAVTKVATNLLSNAFKFTEKGSVLLEVRRGNQDDWTITVTDTGIGIPESARDKIFESFRQVDSSVRRAYGGSGLGLSIVQRLCKAMGGAVRLESTVGKGSTFIVNIPLKTAPSASSASSALSAPSAASISSVSSAPPADVQSAAVVHDVAQPA